MTDIFKRPNENDWGVDQIGLEGASIDTPPVCFDLDVAFCNKKDFNPQLTNIPLYDKERLEQELRSKLKILDIQIESAKNNINFYDGTFIRGIGEELGKKIVNPTISDNDRSEIVTLSKLLKMLENNRDALQYTLDLMNGNTEKYINDPFPPKKEVIPTSLLNNIRPSDQV